MGLAEDGSENHVKFAGDILCVEIRGPRSPRLTIVDLPILIAVNQGEGDDIHIVEAITDRYIKDERSIILPVVNSDVNVQDHGILEKVRVVDPEGKRTFGIITKPDRIEAGLHNETEWLTLARQTDGAFFKFGKGYHVLVSRSGQKTKDGTTSRNVTATKKLSLLKKHGRPTAVKMRASRTDGTHSMKLISGASVI